MDPGSSLFRVNLYPLHEKVDEILLLLDRPVVENPIESPDISQDVIHDGIETDLALGTIRLIL